MRSIQTVMYLNTLQTIYYSSFNAIISYGLIFWGNSPHTIKVFRIHKRIIRIMLGYRQTVSCRKLFKKLQMLPVTSQYILLLMLFVTKHKDHFTMNSDHYSISTRQLNNFHQPTTTFTVYQK